MTLFLILSNFAPVIQTKSLKIGFWGKNYQQQIQVVDSDSNNLNTTVTNLPESLKLTNCTKDGLKTTCLITGTPKTFGRFVVTAVSQDSFGGKNTKEYSLRILKHYIPLISEAIVFFF